MMRRRTTNASSFLSSIDWLLFAATLPLLGAGLVTMYSFVAENHLFERQLVWIGISFFFFFLASFADWRFLRRSDVLAVLFAASIVLLLLLLGVGEVIRGIKGWFDFGFASFQPVEFVKLVLILILAKYFSRRHIEIAHIRHILVSGGYAFLFFLLVLLQPDFGGAMVIFLIWLGMVLLSGISKKHLLAVFIIGTLTSFALWFAVFEEYQKARLMSFFHPLTDILGSGYSAYQSTIAVGSGEILGKGIGFGSQSRLLFLPEYETDFIFAAFAEEWGFMGAALLLAFFGIVLWRILQNALAGASNFEVLFGSGLAILIMGHVTIHVGMNIGLLPITGITLPFLSYGGTHLLTLFLGLGILMGMRRYRRAARPEAMQYELEDITAAHPFPARPRASGVEAPFRRAARRA